MPGSGGHADFLKSKIALRPPRWLLVFIVGLAGTFWLLQPIVLTNDTLGYLEAARFFTSFRFRNWSFADSFPYWRMPLFPLLLALTGAAQGWTVKGIILLHLVFGIAMPILVFFSLSWINTRMAALVSAAVAVSLIPLTNMGAVMTDQLFMFLMVVSVFLACRYIASRRIGDLYALAATCFLAVITRPQGNYLWVVLLAACLAAMPRRWLHCGAAGLFALALQTGYAALRPLIAGPINKSQNEILLPDGEEDQNIVYRRAMQLVGDNRIDSARAVAVFIENPTRGDEIEFAIALKTLANNNPAHSAIAPQRYITDHSLTTSSGRMLIYPVMTARRFDAEALILAQNGPATARLYKLLINYFSTEGKIAYAHLWPGPDDPAVIARNLLNELPPATGQWTLWNILDRIIGPAPADQLCREVFSEFAGLHPSLLAKQFLDSAFRAVTIEGDLPIHADLVADSGMISHFNREVAHSKRFYDAYLVVAELYKLYWIPISVLSLLIAGAGLFFVRQRQLFIVWAMLCAVGAHQLGLCAIAGVPYYRYNAPAFIFFIMAAGITVYAAVRRYPPRALAPAYSSPIVSSAT